MYKDKKYGTGLGKYDVYKKKGTSLGLGKADFGKKSKSTKLKAGSQLGDDSGKGLDKALRY